jgi:hypothetical protein
MSAKRSRLALIWDVMWHIIAAVLAIYAMYLGIIRNDYAQATFLLLLAHMVKPKEDRP